MVLHKNRRRRFPCLLVRVPVSRPSQDDLAGERERAGSFPLSMFASDFVDGYFVINVEPPERGYDCDDCSQLENKDGHLIAAEDS